MGLRCMSAAGTTGPTAGSRVQIGDVDADAWGAGANDVDGNLACAISHSVTGAHGVEPVNELLDVVGELFAVVKIVPRAKRHFEKEDGEGLHDVVHYAPPWALFVDESEVNGFRQKSGYRLCRCDAHVGCPLVKVDRGVALGLVTPLDAAQTRAANEKFGAVVLEAQNELVPFDDGFFQRVCRTKSGETYCNGPLVELEYKVSYIGLYPVPRIYG